MTEMYNKSLDLEILKDGMQEYLDESGSESDGFIQGQDTTFKQAVELFNDLLIYLNDGVMIEDLVVDPTTSSLGRGH